MRSYLYALSFVVYDKPGIVAKVAAILYEKGFNIKDSSSGRMKNIFSMIFLVESKKKYEIAEVEAFFPADLCPAVYDYIEIDDDNAESTSQYTISVYGADKPGIVKSITEKLAEKNINISDLQTQQIGTPPKDTYIMILEVDVPGDTNESWMNEIKMTALNIGTDITLRKLETYEL